LELPTRSRKQNAEYEGIDEDLDKDYSLQQLDVSLKFVEKFKALPLNNTAKPVRRWETKCHEFTAKEIPEKYTTKDWIVLQQNQKDLEPYWRLALRINKWQKNNEKQEKSEDVTDAGDDPDDGDETGKDPLQMLPTDMQFESILHQPQQLTTTAREDLTHAILIDLKKQENLSVENVRQKWKILTQLMPRTGDFLYKPIQPSNQLILTNHK